jgi:hypothetical protein
MLRAKIASLLKKLYRFLLRSIGFYVIQLPSLLVLVVGVFYTLLLLGRIAEDTTTITNIAFGIAASLSALCFSGARAMTDSEEVSASLAYAGERFLHAAVLVLTATILKYALVSASVLGVTWKEVLEAGWSVQPVRTTILVGATVLIGILFGQAVLYAHTGFVVINRLLWSRIPRHPNWDSFW